MSTHWAPKKVCLQRPHLLCHPPTGRGRFGAFIQGERERSTSSSHHENSYKATLQCHPGNSGLIFSGKLWPYLKGYRNSCHWKKTWLPSLAASQIFEIVRLSCSIGIHKVSHCWTTMGTVPRLPQSTLGRSEGSEDGISRDVLLWNLENLLLETEYETSKFKLNIASFSKLMIEPTHLRHEKLFNRDLCNGLW